LSRKKVDSVHVNLSFERSFIEEIKRYAKERQIGYQTMIRLLAVERWLEIKEKRQKMEYSIGK